MNPKREVEILKSMGFEVTEASLQAEKDKHAARVAEDVKRREADKREAEEIGEIVQWVGESVSNHDMLVAAGVVNSDGSLKPYIATGHKSEPLPAF